jgi:cytoskeletal protein CcmA (bactofilin family)
MERGPVEEGRNLTVRSAIVMNDSQIKSKTVLGPDCRISGELSLDNDAVIMGSFSGTLRVSGMLELTESAQVSGTIIVGTLRLAGRAEADVVAEDGVELLPGATLTGQLFTSRLNVVDGAMFQGDVCVGPKAMQAASEAFKLNEPAGQREHFHHQPDQGSMDMAADDADDAEQPTHMGNGNGSMLQRRRPKVLAPRPMMHAGNGAH